LTAITASSRATDASTRSGSSTTTERSKPPTSKRWTSDGRHICRLPPTTKTEPLPEQEETESPLTDSNRRPPPYHGGSGASCADIRDHLRHSSSCKSARLRTRR